jgi:protein-S-isoprenylcysteine O-methyltransferase Ste14
MTPDTQSKSSVAELAVRAAGAWLLLGAIAKLFFGTPKDLPQLIHDLTPFDIDVTFRLVIGVELALVCASFLKPKIAWPALVALFVFFDFVLASQLAAGAESCGCFGASIKVSPYLMLAIDSVLLVAMIVTQPWAKIRRPGVAIPIVGACAALLFALPWLIIRDPQLPTAGMAASADGAPAKARWVTLKPDKWVGKSIFDIPELTSMTEADKLPVDGKLVLWRQSCDHCKEHLAKMASTDDGSKPIVLLQIRDDLESTSLVDLMPSGPNVVKIQFPENQQFMIQTPWEIDVENGNVTKAVLEEQQ